jgi:hypothetical protein
MVADSTSCSPLILPYDSHPEFRFAVGELAVNRTSMESFSEAYRQIENAPLLLSGPERTRLERIAHDALVEVFDELERGTNDSTVRAFLSELRQQCQRVLTADFRHFAGRNREAPRSDEAGDLTRLNEQKFFRGMVSAECLRALSRIAQDPVETFRRRAASGKLTRDDLSVNLGIVPRDIVRILNPEFERLGINRIVSAYARKRVQVCGVALELSVPGATWWRNLYRVERPPQTLYAHTDEGLDYPKSIVYLTDVGERNGPMGVYPGCEERLRLAPLQKLVGRIVGTIGCRPASTLFDLYKVKEAHQGGFTSELFRRHFCMLPGSMKYNSHFGWDVVPDSILEKSLVDAEIKVLGPAGTFAVFDGSRLLHRGGLVEAGERIALQVIFGKPRSLLSLVKGKLASIVKKQIGQTT